MLVRQNCLRTGISRGQELFRRERSQGCKWGSHRTSTSQCSTDRQEGLGIFFHGTSQAVRQVLRKLDQQSTGRQVLGLRSGSSSQDAGYLRGNRD